MLELNMIQLDTIQPKAIFIAFICKISNFDHFLTNFNNKRDKNMQVGILNVNVRANLWECRVQMWTKCDMAR